MWNEFNDVLSEEEVTWKGESVNVKEASIKNLEVFLVWRTRNGSLLHFSYWGSCACFAILKPQAVSHTDNVACTDLTVLFGNRSTHVNPAMQSIHTVNLFKIYYASSPAALVYPCRMILQHSLLSAPWKEMKANKRLYEQCLFPALCGFSVSTVYLGPGVTLLLKKLLLWLSAELLFHYIIANHTCYCLCV